MQCWLSEVEGAGNGNCPHVSQLHLIICNAHQGHGIVSGVPAAVVTAHRLVECGRGLGVGGALQRGERCGATTWLKVQAGAS